MPGSYLRLREEVPRRPRRFSSLDGLSRRDRLAKLSPHEIGILVSSQIRVDDIKDDTMTSMPRVSHWVECFQDAAKLLQDTGNDRRLLTLCDNLRRLKGYPGLCQAVLDFLDETPPEQKASGEEAITRQDHRESMRTPESLGTSRLKAPSSSSNKPVLSVSASSASIRTAEEDQIAGYHSKLRRRDPFPSTGNDRVVEAEKVESSVTSHPFPARPKGSRGDPEVSTRTSISTSGPPKTHERASSVRVNHYVRFATDAKAPPRETSVKEVKEIPRSQPAVVPARPKAPLPANVARTKTTSTAGPASGTTRIDSTPKSPTSHAAKYDNPPIRRQRSEHHHSARRSDNLPRRTTDHYSSTSRQPSTESRRRRTSHDSRDRDRVDSPRRSSSNRRPKDPAYLFSYDDGGSDTSRIVYEKCCAIQ